MKAKSKFIWRMIPVLAIVLVYAVMLAATGCARDPGVPGPQGPAGAAGFRQYRRSLAGGRFRAGGLAHRADWRPLRGVESVAA